ncbi:flavodoxin domain-containing protein [Clostridium sardiniense]|uniref:flavodoxin domain-containing protein n=1 Tax=Clostridium sardiniense TaxID=29369 RepID=UPI003D34D04D
MSGKIALVYKSKYGSTKKYAKWIQEELDCDIYERDEANIKKILGYDTIIYGGGLYASGIKGFELIKKNIDKIGEKRLILFAVGCCLGTRKEIDTIKEKNLQDGLDKKLEFFYLRGGLNFNELKFFDKTAMKMLRNKLANKKEPLTEEETLLLGCYEKPHDWTDKKNIIPLIEYIKGK